MQFRLSCVVVMCVCLFASADVLDDFDPDAGPFIMNLAFSSEIVSESGSGLANINLTFTCGDNWRRPTTIDFEVTSSEVSQLNYSFTTGNNRNTLGMGDCQIGYEQRFRNDDSFLLTTGIIPAGAATFFILIDDQQFFGSSTQPIISVTYIPAPGCLVLVVMGSCQTRRRRASF